MFKRYTGKKRIARSRSYRPTNRWTLASETKRGVLIVILFTLALVSMLSFFQAAGTLGIAFASLLGKLFGKGDWLLPVVLFILSYQLMRPARYDLQLINYVGLILAIAGYSGLFHLPVRDLKLSAIIAEGIGGGYIGYAVGSTLYHTLAFWGTLAILFAMLLIGAFIFFNTSFTTIVSTFQQLRDALGSLLSKRPASPRIVTKPDEEDYSGHFASSELREDEEDAASESDEAGGDTDEANKTAEAVRAQASDVVEMPSLFARPAVKKKRQAKIDLPIELLTGGDQQPNSGDIKANIRKIETTLRNFGIEVTMGEVNVGPTVTQYTLKPTEGVKLNQITALQNDLALALAAHPIRMEAPIPGKSLVGIEVPNDAPSIVKLKDVLVSSVYANRKSDLMVALGKDVSGRALMADLAKMPHLLIAGATGSGKSVAINSMLVSLLYQNSPELLKLILVDPKRVELSSYDGIPHLLTPVIIDIEKTINALRWAVHTMDERYKLLAASGKKNIQGFNASRLLDQMPYIIIVIDELADLMMVAAKEVESAVIRLAQMARAVGIHLILATQRPSVNVITGLIKANITSRIAFAVASVTDSRTILDSSGAEKLLGNGDMLYISAELSKPKRIQGAFIGETEIQAVTDYLKEHGEPQYEEDVVDRRSSRSGAVGAFEGAAEEQDMIRAAEVVIQAKRASATLLQSRMRVGFAKASRLLDLLEERGIIGVQNSSKPREVLMSLDEFKTQFGGGLDRSEASDPSQANEKDLPDDIEDYTADENEEEREG
ncbi:MAG: DNA translocase FtsK 4TM domain-containing protein [Patescibacteria group bacterium]